MLLRQTNEGSLGAEPHGCVTLHESLTHCLIYEPPLLTVDRG